MIKTLLVLSLVLFTTSAWAQEPTLNIIPFAVDSVPVPMVEASPMQTDVVDSKFYAVSGFLVGATAFDVWTTFRGVHNGAREANPLMRPFVEAGVPAMVAFQAGLDGGILYWSYRLKKDHERYWWLLPVVIGTSHAVAGGFNIRYAHFF